MYVGVIVGAGDGEGATVACGAPVGDDCVESTGIVTDGMSVGNGIPGISVTSGVCIGSVDKERSVGAVAAAPAEKPAVGSMRVASSL